MKRLKYFFACFLVIFALPFWRFLDLIAVFSPTDGPYKVLSIIGFIFFIAIPLKLYIERTKKRHVFIGSVLFAGIVWQIPLLSQMASKYPQYGHCNFITYTGMFYHIRNFLPESYTDDLEIRNQLCWIRKLIRKSPDSFDSVTEFNQYATITRDKLLSPEIKYTTSLPLIAFLNLHLLTSMNFPADSISHDSNVIIKDLNFWSSQYTTRIQDRDYSFLSYIHGAWIKFEYGLIEKNWPNLVESLTPQSP